MFTGLIEDIGTVLRLEQHGAAGRLEVTTGLPGDEIKLGESVAVNGVCLTVVAKGGGALSFDVSPESLKAAGFARLRPGSRVNLERALRLSDRLGGHIVTGHVDCTATIAGRREISGNTVFSFNISQADARYLVSKGSVAIDGVSLTVNEVSPNGFTVNIIPHTSLETTLHLMRPGDVVNIEFDILAKYVERLLPGGETSRKGGLSLELLAETGFL